MDGPQEAQDDVDRRPDQQQLDQHPLVAVRVRAEPAEIGAEELRHGHTRCSAVASLAV